NNTSIASGISGSSIEAEGQFIYRSKVRSLRDEETRALSYFQALLSKGKKVWFDIRQSATIGGDISHLHLQFEGCSRPGHTSKDHPQCYIVQISSPRTK